ncbi:outer membrane protein TolC [Algoriphagus sp. 4150]|uniref:TolC family protein n=1 Tax=Algoriphagus sp. 4150 TaxID=2817756 RepID=UPI00285FC5CB|nr:TolC family protein [Algoriphagus sp. 4150]MDR7131871.1 outer membrane protein TolC [Algoriphagus sp. 4150]
MSIWNRQYTLVILFTLSSFFPVSGQSLSFSSWAEVYEYAKDHQPDFLIWEKTADQQTYGVRNAKGGLMPLIKAYGNYDNFLQLPVQLIPSEVFGGEPGTFTEIQFGTQYQLDVGLEASLPLVDTKAWNRVKSAKLEKQLSNAELQSARQNHKEQLARAYYLAILSQEALELSEANYKAADSIHHVARQQFDQGVMEPLPYRRLKAAAFLAKSNYHRQVSSTSSNYNKLKYLMGLDQEDSIHLTETIVFQARQEDIPGYSLETQPDYQKAASSLELAERDLKASRQRHLPTLNAVGRYSQQAWSDDMRMGNYTWFSTAMIGLRLEWSIFGGNLTRNQINSTKLQREISEAGLRQTQQKLVQERHDLSTDLAQNLEILKNYRETYSVYEDNYRLARIQLREGEISIDELLQVQQELWDNQRQYLNSLADYLIAKALIEIKSE